jgi:formate--tetrahydrofolate ligase
VVLVATVRALKMNGGVAKADLTGKARTWKRCEGFGQPARHIENVKKFGITPTIAINHFYLDTDAELAVIVGWRRVRRRAVICKHWAEGGAGTEELAHIVAANRRQAARRRVSPLYPSEMPLAEKINTIARASTAPTRRSPTAVRKPAQGVGGHGLRPLPGVHGQDAVFSFTTDPTALGAPATMTVPIREVRLSAGAGFVVAIAGEIMTMPGLPKVPERRAHPPRRERPDRRAVLSLCR